MGPAADRSKFLRTETRRRIARHAALAPCTISDLARRMGVPDGSLRRTVKDMADEQVLVEAEAPHASGAAFRLSDTGRAALEQVGESLSPPGLLVPGQTVILVSGGALSGVAGELSDAVGRPGLAWTTRFEGGPLFGLIAFEAGAESVDRDRVLASLQDRGVECMPGHVGWIKGPQESSSYARALIAQSAAPPALDSGSDSE